MGATRWPAGAPNLSCTAEEDALPFPDLMFDRDPAGARAGGGGERAPPAARDLARAEGRRAAAGRGAEPPRHVGVSGRARRSATASPIRPAKSAGCWQRRCFAWSGGTPRSICRPSNWRAGAARRARCSSGPGANWLPGFAGVTITEAVKDMYAAMPVEAVPRRRLILAEPA